jgi:hypothetical protein
MMVSGDQQSQEAIAALIAKAVERRADRSSLLLACQSLLAAAHGGGLDLRQYKKNTWAAGALHLVARMNLLTAADHETPLSVATICKHLRTSQATMYKRSRQLELAAGIGPFDPRILFDPKLRSLLGDVSRLAAAELAAQTSNDGLYRLFMGAIDHAKPADLALAFESKTAVDRIFRFELQFAADAAPELEVRRVLEITDCTLHHLHECIQALMGWDSEHLYEFRYQRQRYDDPRVEPVHGIAADESVLSEIFPRMPRTESKRLLNYLYDFGEEWQVQLRLLSIADPQSETAYPRCTAAAGVAPEEGASALDLKCLSLAAQADRLSPRKLEEGLAELEACGVARESFDRTARRAAAGPPDLQSLNRRLQAGCQSAHQWLTGGHRTVGHRMQTREN